jgi:hypothetical protein
MLFTVAFFVFFCHAAEILIVPQIVTYAFSCPDGGWVINMGGFVKTVCVI